MRGRGITAVLLGMTAAAFFALTFVLNRQMQLGGGSWLWTAALRFVFMLPVLFALLLPRRRWHRVLLEIRRQPAGWLVWSLTGFGVFYTFLCLASSYGAAWLTASTWQVTIIAGVLLTPLIRSGRDQGRPALPGRQVVVAGLILAGVALVQLPGGAAVTGGAEAGTGRTDILGGLGSLLCMVLAAFAYPLGNRQMMRLVPAGFGTLERVFGMTLCSLPLWLVLMLVAGVQGIGPTPGQLVQSAVVALSSGVVATLLFFKATDLVRSDARQLAVVESTQAGEVVFSLLAGVLVFGDPAPGWLAVLGMAVIVAGIVLNSLLARPSEPGEETECTHSKTSPGS